MPIIESLLEKAPPAAPLRLVAPHRADLSPLSSLDALNPARRYLQTLAAPSRRSMRANLERVARLLRVPFEAVPWAMLRAPHVEALRARMQDLGLAPATVNVTLAALRGVARQAFALHALPGDDYQLIREVKNVRGRRDRAGRAVEISEVAALLEACARDETAAGARDKCLVTLLAGAGLRRAEAVALDVADYGARVHTLRVRGKGDKDRTVYLEDGAARRALAAWLRARGGGKGPLLTPVDRLGRVGLRRLSGQAVYNALVKRAREAKLRRTFSPHSMRRFFASLLDEEGAGLVEISELLGHASVVTTAGYIRQAERAKRKAAKLIRLPYKAAGGRGGRRRRKRCRRRSGGG